MLQYHTLLMSSYSASTLLKACKVVMCAERLEGRGPKPQTQEAKLKLKMQLYWLAILRVNRGYEKAG